MVDEQRKEEKKFDGYMVEVVEKLPMKTGMFGSVHQVMCKVIDQNSRDRGRVIRRNITGRVKVGDILRFSDTSREDKPINVK